MKRRTLLQAGLTGALAARIPRSGQGPSIALVVDPSDPVAMSVPAQVAVEVLRQRLIAAGASVRLVQSRQHLAAGEQAIDLGQRASQMLAESEARGLAYAVLDLADRIGSGQPLSRILRSPVSFAIERPDNPVRSVMRQFVSGPLDKPWFYDRAAWSRYLTMLATHRFNRLHLAFGLGYDALQRVTDSYLLFAYPFLVDVPGYSVRVTNLDAAEREQNLEMLRFISEETVAHGLDFQLGLWMHGYQLINSPDARYVALGLTSETHANYCRDALTMLLRELPAISSVGLRIHGESGIAEGSYEFWGTVFDGVARAGRRVEIDLHAKGIDAAMIARAQATGMPVNVSPKFAAEHLGLPYHQAAIRELEMPVAGRTGQGLMTLSEGARSFTRYGYADLLREDRTYTVRPRVFSGTQRILAWGDPDFARAFSEAAGFCGMTGADLMEPLTCRGRRGTGVGRRDGYANAEFATRDDWAKYSAWYRSFGRMMYSRATAADVFERELGEDPDARALRLALSKASRILPLVTQSHLPSAACDAYWPEIYWNQPIVAPAARNPYFDTGTPTTFQHVSPLDPALFSSCAEYATTLLEPRPDARYSPVDVAVWLEALMRDATTQTSPAQRPAAHTLLSLDIGLQSALGGFFAAKLRAGVLYAVHERSGSVRALREACTNYGMARDAFEFCAQNGARHYQADLSASDRFDERGQWSDKLALIDDDMAQMAARLEGLPAGAQDGPLVVRAIAEAKRAEPRRAPRLEHTPPPGMVAGQGVTITLRNPVAGETWIHYRHVSQAERWVSARMDRRSETCRFVIPPSYADSPYPLQYYFEVRERGGAALFPGFAPDLLNQPYFVLRRRG